MRLNNHEMTPLRETKFIPTTEYMTLIYNVHNILQVKTCSQGDSTNKSHYGVWSCIFLSITVLCKSLGLFGVLWCKMAFFKKVWQKVKVPSRPWALGFKSALIRPLKWGTLCLWTPTGSKMASRQSWKNEKKVRLNKEALTKTDFVYVL